VSTVIAGYLVCPISSHIDICTYTLSIHQCTITLYIHVSYCLTLQHRWLCCMMLYMGGEMVVAVLYSVEA
jgi:hypothetical protein